MRDIVIEHAFPPEYLTLGRREEARAGLTATPKRLPPKWFYDATGSALFDKITGLPEYYPARTEHAILRAHAAEIAAASGAHTLTELGSGSSAKTRVLLDALQHTGTLRRYVPLDISEAALQTAARSLLADFPDLAIQPVAADFDHLPIPATSGPAHPRLTAFLGGTVGNLLPAQRADFLAGVRSKMFRGDSLLLGTDLVKDPAILLAAYDDAAGVTAAFNKNMLSVLNTELGAGFDTDAFEHVALWDGQQEWIEMRLRAACPQTVPVPALGLTVTFADGEELRTEVSAKFRRDGVEAELADAGLTLTHWWTDPDGLYGLSLSVPA